MKYAIVAVLFVFALAQGSQAQDAQNIPQALENFKTQFMEEVNKIVTSDFSTSFQTWFESKKTEMEAMGPQVQEQMQSLLTTIEQSVKPVETNLKPVFENIKTQAEGLFQRLADQARPIAN